MHYASVELTINYQQHKPILEAALKQCEFILVLRKLICSKTQGGWDDQPGGQKTERGRTIQIWKILTGQDDVPENHWFTRFEPDPTRETMDSPQTT